MFSDSRMTVFGMGQDEQRRFTMWDPDPCSAENPVLAAKSETEYTLYCPHTHQSVYSEACELTPMLALERIFACRNRLILHSAVVIHRGEAVLFSAPSGVGKSTQAALWEKCFGAEILNGDRCVIEKTETGWVAHGSPYSGSSEICKCSSAPIKGVFLLRQAPENRIREISLPDAFRECFKQTVINLWNREQVQTITELLAQMTQELPVLRFDCRPDNAAAELAEKTLF